MDLSDELARSLLELAPDATVVVDGEGRIVFANAQVNHTFGYTPGELIGMSVERLLPERFRRVHSAHRAQFATSAKPRPMGAGLSLLGLHSDGHEFPVQISLSPVSTTDGLLVVAAIRDATAQREAEHRLVEQNRAKSRFLAAASHDLRQPLQTLNLLNRVAMRQVGDNLPLREVLGRQQHALDSMSGLLSSVLDISKLDSGAVIPHAEDFVLAELFERLRLDFEPQAAAKGIELTIEAPAAAVRTDPELLRRLLGNLIANAIRYTSRGEVKLDSRADGAHSLIRVVDTGIGIAASERERIFDEFYQIDQGAQRPEGLGLGLSIVKRLATLLGLDLELDSVPGGGTEFRVAVPAGELPVVAGRQAREPIGSLGGRILIIDDEPSVAEAMRMLLRMEGFDARVASSAAEALERLAQGVPDLIISDCRLRGGETGVDAVSALRQRLGTLTPVVFVTGDTAHTALSGESIRNAQVVNKPIRAEDLLAAVQSSLRTPRDTPD
jgi:two-component system, sensor histidine kinase